jgi:hypothetical protein
MGHWKKYFSDGTSSTGTDRDCMTGKASWRKSRNQYMVGAEIEHDGRLIGIYGPGEYWQTDTYEATVRSTGHPTLIQRKICRKLEASDLYYSFRKEPVMTRVWFDKQSHGRMARLSSGNTGQWFILELDINTGKIKHYIGNKP